MKGDTVRISVEVTKETNEQLLVYIPWGLKADVVRAILDLILKEARENRYIITDLLNGKCQLVQNLNKSVQHDKTA